MSESKQVVLQDNENIKYVIVEVDLKSNKTRIMSSLSLWGNIRVFASSIGVSYRKMIADGENPITTYKMLEKIIVEMLETDYDIEENHEENSTRSDRAGSNSEKTESVATESTKTEGVIDNKQPVDKNNNKPKKENKKPIRSKNKNKKAN